MRQKFNRIVKGSFNDQKYIDNYLKIGSFPKIHDDIALMVRNYANEKEPCFDIGSCIGILAVRNVVCGRSFCLGIEGNKFDFDRAIKHPKVSYKNYFIEESTFDKFIQDLQKYKPTLITARRVISEIGFYKTETVNSFAEILKSNGVKKIILQGRVPVKNPTVELWNSELEVKALSKFFKPIKKYKDVYLLENK